MTIERSRQRVAASRVRDAAGRLLDASTLCAIATVSDQGRAHINTAYFAWSDDFDVVWLSHPQARHSRNVRANGRVAIAVYDSSQTWGKPDRGIQLHGSAREVTARAEGSAEAVYGARFRDYDAADFAAYRFYRFRPRRVKLFDETFFGTGVFVTARVGRDGALEWGGTELYR
jgi:uncharacterized protein YhbP (UPF0306 family)